MTTIELRQKRAALAEQARAIVDKAENENRALTAEENQEFDRMMTDVDEIRQRIDRLEKLSNMELEQNASRGRQTRDEARSQYPEQDALRGWLLLGSDVRPSDDQLRAVQSAGLTGKTFTLRLRPDALKSTDEFRAWQNRAQAVGTQALGGYTVAQDFAGEVERAMLAFGGMRAASRVLRTATGADLPFPLADDSLNEAVIIGENTEISDTPDIQFGSKTLKSFKYTSNIVKVSTELLQDSAVNIAEVVGSMLGERVARGTGRHFTTGNGTTQPEGAVTGAFLGVTAASNAAISYDEIVDLVHSVDPAYRSNGAKFMFHDQTLKALKKLKDSQNRPLWKAGLAEGEPDTIDGYPYIINQQMPQIGSATKSMLFGDFSRHIIRDVQDIVIVRLDERYAEFGQVAFVALSRHDSRVLDAGQHPIKYLQQAV